MTLADRADEGLGAVDAAVVRNPSEYDTFVAVFARTYQVDGDAAALVDLYQDFQEYTASHPNAGSQRIATALGVKRPRIRKWVDDGAVPYVVQGLETAETQGWIPMEFESRIFAAMNKLVAWVFSSGSIHGERWDVQFVTDDDQQRQRLTQLIQAVGCDVVELRSSEKHVKGTELRVSEHGAFLGRVLHALGAPKGQEKQTVRVRLPAYLDDAPPFIRRAFLQTYLRNRQRERDREKPHLSFGEDRPDQYLDSLVALIEDVTGESASWSPREVYVSEAAVTTLDV